MTIDTAADILNRHIEEDKVPWYRKRNLRILYLLMIPTCIGVQATNGFDASAINGLQAVPTWDAFFGHPRSTLLGVLSSLYALGGVCSLPFVPLAADNLGRRWAIAFGSAIMIIGAALQTAFQDFAMFVVARFLLGFGSPFAVIASSLMIAEVAYPKERARITSLLFINTIVGAVIASGVTLGTFAIPNNWEAYGILAKYHAEGDLNSEFVKLEYADIEKGLERAKQQGQSSWKQLIATRGMRRRLLICSFLGVTTQWSGSSLLAYFLPRVLENIGVRDARTQNLFNVALSCWTLVNGTALALTVPNWKRRTAFLTCTIGITAVFTGLTVASANYAETGSQAASRAVIALIFLATPVYNIAYTTLLYTYLVELFPFQVRAKGLAVFEWWSRAAGFFNQFVNPIGIHNAGWKYYIVFCIFLLFQVIFIYFLFPETANRSLEELEFLYEDDKLGVTQQNFSDDELEMTKKA